MNKTLFSALLLMIFLSIGNRLFAQTEHMTIVRHWSRFIPCLNEGNGEVVSGTVTEYHTNLHTKTGHIPKFKMRIQGTLIGETTGMVYHVSGPTQEISRWKPDGTSTHTWIHRFHLVGKGVQYLSSITVHSTYNANRILTADIEKFEVECK